MKGSVTRSLATARRVLRQLRHDPRTVGLMIIVPCVLETLLRLIYTHRRQAFDPVASDRLPEGKGRAIDCCPV